ncbi:hypothetical protein [Corynebacterium variabile]|uniref:hypothetical protein n=1 Tax=Corynebacterium variabile TaxID=1727 RepID=UPI003A934830
MHVTYTTATTVNGFLATEDDSLDWLMAVGGETQDLGDLAGQFLDAGLLDEITLHLSPVFLAKGKSLLPRDLASDRLTLVQARQIGQFIEATWRISHP